MRWLPPTDNGDDENEASRWLQPLRLIHSYCQQLNTCVLVVLRALLHGSFLRLDRYDILLDRSSIRVGKGAEYAPPRQETLRGEFLVLEEFLRVSRDDRRFGCVPRSCDLLSLRPGMVQALPRFSLEWRRSHDASAVILAQLQEGPHDWLSCHSHLYVVLR